MYDSMLRIQSFKCEINIANPMFTSIGSKHCDLRGRTNVPIVYLAVLSLGS